MRYPILSALVFTLFTVGASASEHALAIGDGVELGDSQQTLERKLRPHCASLRNHIQARVSYPLAAKTETHLICQSYQKGDMQFEKAVFVVADGKLAQMEANGVADALVRKYLGEAAWNYIGMDVYQEGTFWFEPAQSRLVWLHDDAMHPNLFAWHNPQLWTSEIADYRDSTAIPAVLDFTASLDELRREFKKQCKYVQEDQSERIWLPNKPQKQVQINCFGYEYAGFERKFEAVFGDGQLQLVWILTGKQEEQRLRKQLIADWGEAGTVNDNWEVFQGGRIALRKDKPEFLVLSDEMIPFFKKRMESE